MSRSKKCELRFFSHIEKTKIMLDGDVKYLINRLRATYYNSIFTFPELTFHDFSPTPHPNKQFNSTLNEQYPNAVLLLARTLYQFNHLVIQFYQIYHYYRLVFCLFCALPPLVKSLSGPIFWRLWLYLCSI